MVRKSEYLKLSKVNGQHFVRFTKSELWNLGFIVFSGFFLLCLVFWKFSNWFLFVPLFNFFVIIQAYRQRFLDLKPTQLNLFQNQKLVEDLVKPLPNVYVSDGLDKVYGVDLANKNGWNNQDFIILYPVEEGIYMANIYSNSFRKSRNFKKMKDIIDRKLLDYIGD